MFVELVVVVVFGLDSLLRHHDAQQDALVLLQCVPLLQVLEGEISDDVEIDRDVGCSENLYYTI